MTERLTSRVVLGFAALLLAGCSTAQEDPGLQPADPTPSENAREQGRGCFR